MRRTTIYLPVIIGLIALSPLLYSAAIGGFYGVPKFPTGEEISFGMCKFLFVVFVASQFSYAVIDAKINRWSEYKHRKYAVLFMLLLSLCLPLLNLTLFQNRNSQIGGVSALFTFAATLLFWLPITVLCLIGKQPTIANGRFVPVFFCVVTTYYNMYVIAHMD